MSEGRRRSSRSRSASPRSSRRVPERRRSRSPPSPSRGSRRRDSRSRSREDRRRSQDRSRNRSRDRSRGRSKSRERDRKAVPFGERSEQAKRAAGQAPDQQAQQKKIEITADMSEEQIMKLMGLPVDFDTTKGKEVPDGNVGYARVKSQRKYRQYMNRRGGFNRMLDGMQ